jgi:hypothetical protein
MNIDLDLVNRALLDVGQSPLTDQDAIDKNTNYRLCREYYLNAFLEALSEVEWTGGRKRVRLVRTGRPVLKDYRYAFAYDMPFDCAKPVELQDNEFFIVEDRIIYTDVPNAELLYVSDGKILRTVRVVSAGRPGDIPKMEYLSAGPPGTRPLVTFRAGRPKDFLWFGPQEYPGAPYPDGHVPPGWNKAAGIPVPLPEDPDSAEDYPDYLALGYEPKFYEYIERGLAAKLSMKLSDQPALHVQMLQEALLIKQEAVRASRSRAAAKIKPVKWWTEELW